MIDSIEVLAALAALTISPEKREAPGVPPQFTAEQIARVMDDSRDYWEATSGINETLGDLDGERLVVCHGPYEAVGNDRWPAEGCRWSIKTEGIFKVLCR